MSGLDLLARWTSAAWRTEVDAWVHDALGAHGTPPTGPGEQVRTRFWSVVRRYPTAAGPVWFKEGNPGQGFEAPLMAELARLLPDSFPTPLAVDAARARLLLPHAGPTPERGSGPLPEVTLTDVLTAAAGVQQALVGHREELLAAGLPPLAPEQVPAWAEEVVDDLARRPLHDPQHLAEDDRRRVEAGLPRLRAWAEELAGAGVPSTFQHDDLNPRNMAVRDGRLRWFDVGDAFWSHPFAVVQVPLAMWTSSWPWGPDPADPRVARVLDAYLGTWTGPGRDLVSLRRLVRPALLLAQVHRCESWRRLLAPVDPHRLGTPAPRLAEHLLHVTGARP